LQELEQQILKSSANIPLQGTSHLMLVHYLTRNTWTPGPVGLFLSEKTNSIPPPNHPHPDRWHDNRHPSYL